eukprot:c7660_g1_i1 orf=2-160(-)
MDTDFPPLVLPPPPPSFLASSLTATSQVIVPRTLGPTPAPRSFVDCAPPSWQF